MEKVSVGWEELNNLLFFLEKNVDEEERLIARVMIQSFLGSVNREHYYQGIDVYSLADRVLRFREEHSPTILQVEVERNDAVLTIYHGDEETYGDFESMELYRLPFATKTEFDLLEVIKKKIKDTVHFLRGG